ncbi:hypothetical protein [Oceanobacillus kimchii]|uniref:hypothetical protein n=1 Tax=Oceanobacillus kimchii TaxID=746691 RepID=UPI00295E3158|nr:hypothetical protein [Oceanobacillus kimchii]
MPANEYVDAEWTSYYYNDGDHVEFEDVEDLIEYVTDYVQFEGEEYCQDLRELIELEDVSFDELWRFVKNNLNECGFFDECSVREESFIVPNTMFITKQDAKNHLLANKHHYSKKAHTYAMTAWRSPKVSKLMTILETMDWSEINKDIM